MQIALVELSSTCETKYHRSNQASRAATDISPRQNDWILKFIERELKKYKIHWSNQNWQQLFEYPIVVLQFRHYRTLSLLCSSSFQHKRGTCAGRALAVLLYLLQSIREYYRYTAIDIGNDLSHLFLLEHTLQTF